MTLAQTLQAFEALDSAHINGGTVRDLLRGFAGVEVSIRTAKGEKGQTDFVHILLPGTRGKQRGGAAPTLGIIGRLGGVGARPNRIGLVSDGDGAVAAVAVALKIATMASKGDALDGDVIVSTHICPDAPTRPHQPVDFMGSPVDAPTVSAHELHPDMDAVLSIDTTKGNRVLNHKGYAITPTVRQGWILRIADDLLRIMEMTSGRSPVTLPITMQDITPYGNDVYHLNSILQPAVNTSAPVVGVAICTESVVPGCGTGASHEIDIAAAVRFSVEVAKEFGRGTCRFFDPQEFERLVTLYGPMTHLQKRLAGQDLM